MAGKKGMRWKNRTLDPDSLQELRNRIQAGEILNKLKEFILGGQEMQPHQVTAAVALLRKVMPDLSASDVTARVEHVHTNEADIFSRLVPESPGRDADSPPQSTTTH